MTKTYRFDIEATVSSSVLVCLDDDEPVDDQRLIDAADADVYDPVQRAVVEGDFRVTEFELVDERE